MRRKGFNTYLHNKVGVAHASVDSKLGQRVTAVLLHGGENGLGLEARGLEGCTGDVSSLGVRGDTEDGASSIIDPVRSEETAEGSDESAAAIVLDSLGESAELGGRLDEAKVVHEELDTGTSDSDATLEGVHSLALAEVECDSGQKTVRRDDRLGTDVVQKEAACAVSVLGKAGSESLLADKRSGLITQAACDLDALESSASQRAVGLDIGGAHDLGERDLLAIEAEPINEIGVVIQSLEVHEHGARSIGGVRHEDIAIRTAVELVGQPGVDGAESQNTSLIGILDGIDILQQPKKLAGGGVCGERKTAAGSEFAGAKTVLQLADELLRSGVGPDNGVVQGLSSGLVPDNGGFALVGDAHGLDLLAGVALGLECLDCAVDAGLNGADNLLGVMLVPAIDEKLACDCDNGFN